MAVDKFNPTQAQRRFFEDHILDEGGTVLSLKVVAGERRGFSVNIRGPFVLVPYKFPKHAETVIDAKWAGVPESKSHMHCCWPEIRFARLSEANPDVQDNIKHKWQVSFFASEESALVPDEGGRLFWFYLKDDRHKAVKAMTAGRLVDLTTPVTSRRAPAPGSGRLPADRR